MPRPSRSARILGKEASSEGKASFDRVGRPAVSLLVDRLRTGICGYESCLKTRRAQDHSHEDTSTPLVVTTRRNRRFRGLNSLNRFMAPCDEIQKLVSNCASWARADSLKQTDEEGGPFNAPLELMMMPMRWVFVPSSRRS